MPVDQDLCTALIARSFYVNEEKWWDKATGYLKIDKNNLSENVIFFRWRIIKPSLDTNKSRHSE